MKEKHIGSYTYIGIYDFNSKGTLLSYLVGKLEHL